MAIFIDSSKLNEIEKYHKFGIIRGVTTNPTIMVQDGVTGGINGIKARSIEIANLVACKILTLSIFSLPTN